MRKMQELTSKRSSGLWRSKKDKKIRKIKTHVKEIIRSVEEVKKDKKIRKMQELMLKRSVTFPMEKLLFSSKQARVFW